MFHHDIATLKQVSAGLVLIFETLLSGTTTLHAEMEECVANFVGKPAAIVFGMGYVTNSAILPVLIGKVREISWLNRL